MTEPEIPGLYLVSVHAYPRQLVGESLVAFRQFISWTFEN
jgi:hypothetical protein